MKFMRALFLTLALLLSFACNTSRNYSGSSSSAGGTRESGVLTRDKAQKALDKALEGSSKGGTVTVQGVRELPSENAAEAELNFQNFRWQAPLGLGSYSGAGTARFSHYSDGRWVLSKVIWSYGTSLDANVEVK